MRWSEEEYQEYINKIKGTPLKPKKKSKYNAKITKIDGITFRSKKEADKYVELKIRQIAGDIKGFCMQPKFVLVEGTDEERAITYAADFIVFNNDNTYKVIDTKGFESEQWKRTYKMFKIKFPEIDLTVEK